MLCRTDVEQSLVHVFEFDVITFTLQNGNWAEDTQRRERGRGGEEGTGSWRRELKMGGTKNTDVANLQRTREMHTTHGVVIGDDPDAAEKERGHDTWWGNFKSHIQ